jgi:maltose alpha-D-glucosyltransferase/alpha-amylase
MGSNRRRQILLPKEPLWYKSAVIYEVHIRAFYDSNADGIGDLPGLTEKLDYLQDLGVTAIWLLPFYPSPLKDDGYDIADYYSLNPIYGTLSDFRLFLHEAHERGLRVVTELVVNHTSDQHPWFQRARRAKPGSVWRDYYVWSDTPVRYKDARIIFKDFEPSNWTWDPLAQAYYWHRFYAHQPDLNYDNPQVHKEIARVLDFWLGMGVDGLRLDAVPYLYEREGTSCENLVETHAYLKTLRQHVDAAYGDRMLLAEANQWPEDAVSYFGAGKGDECHMAFHFPLMPRLFMALRMEDRVPIVDILEQTPPIPETSQWALFLRNHDELTLEMVTDEERDYMYRVYAHDVRTRINLGIRRRLAPLLGNDRKRIELLNLLLLSLPGTPVLYYGDEIGMGDNTFLGDRNGVRTPMQWSSDKNAGFSRASPQALYLPVILEPEYHYETVNVEAHQRNPHSLLWWTKRVLALRKQWKAFGHGTIEFLQPENRKVLAFIRRFEQECVLVVANLSRFPQPVALNLSAFKEMAPVELFGRTEFPIVSEKPYLLTLSPHALFWFSLEPTSAKQYRERATARCERLEAANSWEELLTEEGKSRLEPCLPGYVQERRWFGAKSREIKSVHIREAIPVELESGEAFLTILGIEYMQGESEEYLLPLAFASGPQAEQIQGESPHLVVARVQVGNQQNEGILHDAVGNKAFAKAVFEAMSRRRTLRGEQGEVEASCTPAFRAIRGGSGANLEPLLSKAEQSNSAVRFGDKFFLKFFRRLDVGVNPDLEVGRFLTTREFLNTPAVAGALELRRANGDVISLAILSALIPAARDAWDFTLDTLSRYFERVRTLPPETKVDPLAGGSILDLAEAEIPKDIAGVVGISHETARLLGQRTAELHLALASDSESKDFAPESFTPFYQRSLYQSMRNLTVRTMQVVRQRLTSMEAELRPLAEKVAAMEPVMVQRLRSLVQTRINCRRIRCHGDYHLGQVLYTGKDFMVIDFEGEPVRPLGERRIKRSPFRDVAGMIRSFDYASYAALFRQLELGNVPPEQLAQVEPWTRLWYRWTSATFLRAYLDTIRPGDLVPSAKAELSVLLNAFLLEKAIYEVGYELNNRPKWVKIPLQGILQLLEARSPA